MEILKSKHPTGQQVTPDSITHGAPLEIHPVIFDGTDARLIRTTALQTSGATGMDAYARQRLCVAFKSA